VINPGPCRASQPVTALTGALGLWLQRQGSPGPRFTAGCRPSRSNPTAEAFGCKLSIDPFFVETVRDIVGLYLNPPDNAMVVCVDEKTQIQSMDSTQKHANVRAWLAQRPRFHVH